MKKNDLKKHKLPDKPGVYFFYKGKTILYVGKATSLRDRAKSYFGKDLIATRGPLVVDMVFQATFIKWQETDSVLEALILEANLIKKYQPKYNTKEKDNKSFNYVCFTKPTKENLIPKVLIIRGRDLKISQKNIFRKVLGRGEWEPVPDHFQKYFSATFSSIFGPFPNGLLLREAMKIIRRIFPYIDGESSKKNNIEFYKQLGLIPDLITQEKTFQKVLGRGRTRGQTSSKKIFSVSLEEYKNNLKNIKLFFEGKKKKIILNLKKEMSEYAKKKEFEKAGIVKRKIFALNHINDVALIKDDITQENIFGKVLGSPRDYTRSDHSQKYFPAPLFRIEAYDIAHMSGQSMVGVMVVVENGEVNKSEYRKFIIKTQKGSNDTGALEEVLSRRLRHSEWGLPNLIVVDGGTAQKNVANQVVSRYQFKIPVVSVVKDDRHKPKAIMGDEIIIKKYKKEILLSNSEAHRFAIAFHKDRRSKKFLK